ncbi:MAG: YebG family protein [Aliidiomarina sp.]|uniref:YebG family protein n=1 Tax=Aliidiomarina sp. TaxID=1872439 RepID=UPI0025BA0EFF|nr:YebG family protein [Aliidiomarina sp.]MCH8500538.1 YebG family protein [Aliidiomarina sp.]
MAVVTQYLVVRNGEQKMTFTSKAEADAYDKMLDMAEGLMPLLESSELCSNDQQIEDLAMFLAKEREGLLVALGAKKAKPKKPKPVAKAENSESSVEKESSAEKDSAAA